jgi:hypothetical protein
MIPALLLLVACSSASEVARDRGCEGPDRTMRRWMLTYCEVIPDLCIRPWWSWADRTDETTELLFPKSDVKAVGAAQTATP